MTSVTEDTELTVTTPDEPGIFGRVLGTLANAGVNVRAFYVYSETDQGHFHLVTSDAKKAETALRTLGYKVKSKKVVTVRVTDRIGAGAEIGALLGNAVIAINYAYGSSSGEGKSLLVFHTSNNRKALDTLK
ncbi:MAG: ACT domain-containing protein [Acidobacteria bacterium]|nr:ACT domain-containing protein [Acidobacteriota bacterium]